MNQNKTKKTSDIDWSRGLFLLLMGVYNIIKYTVATSLLFAAGLFLFIVSAVLWDKRYIMVVDDIYRFLED